MHSCSRAPDPPTAWLPDLPPIPTQEIDDDEVRQVRSWFVPPAGYESARKLLSPSQPVLILTGPTGSGKRTMALRLLWDRSRRHWDEAGAVLAIRELLPDWEEPNPRRLPVEREHGYLLDLGRHDQRLLWPFAKGLKDYAGQLNAAGSYLVVTGTDTHWQYCKGVLEQKRIRLDQPAPARSIVEQRVQEQRRGWLDHPAIRPLLAGRLAPADAVRLAEAIERVPAADESGIGHARTEYLRGRWWPDLADWFTAHPRSAARALLIAAAVLDGCPADEIWQAGAALARRMGGDAQATDPLAGPGRTRLLEQLGVPDLRPDGVVSLSGQRPGFDGAVIDYVLAEHAELAGPLWRWIDDPVMTAGYVQLRIDRIARTIAGRAVRRERAADFFTQLPGLADGPPGHRRLAQALLALTARDPVIGAEVRGRITRWAERPGTRELLVVAIAEVCGGALAEQFPVVALATLRRILLRRDSAAVERAALAALARVADRPDLRRLVLQVVVRWMRQPDHRYAGGMAFLWLMHPGHGSVVSELTNQVADDPQVFRLLRLGWQWLPGTGVPEPRATELIAAWEAAARSGQLRRDVVADLLVLAIEDDVRRMATSPSGGAAAGAGGGDRRVELVGRVLTLR